MATELESNLYKQTATYKHFEVMYNLRALETWAVNETAYKIIKKAIHDLNKLCSEDFGEDRNGKLVRDLIQKSKPIWKD